MILGGTGHRRPKLVDGTPLARWVQNEIIYALKRLKPELVISGMALDFDMWLAEGALALGIPYDAYVPCTSQSNGWPVEDHRRHLRLLTLARRIVMARNGPYVEGCMQKRNEMMVNDSGAMLACFDGSQGGTFNCVRYATLKRKPIEFIDPNRFRP